MPRIQSFREMSFIIIRWLLCCDVCKCCLRLGKNRFGITCGPIFLKVFWCWDFLIWALTWLVTIRCFTLFSVFFRISDSFPKTVVGSNRSVLDRNSYPVNLSYFSLVQLYLHFSINFLDTFELFVKLRRFCILLQFFIKGKEIAYGFKSLYDFKIASNYLPILL